MSDELIDAISEHSAYHRYDSGAVKGLPTHSVADCPDLAPLLAADAKARDDVALLADRIKELEVALRDIVMNGQHQRAPDYAQSECRCAPCQRGRAALYPKEAAR